jgi:fermentation-respiration switch protein FrsA (DUF1100 family)
MHGDADTVIPYEQGRALYEGIRGPKQFFTMRGADHNDATPPEEVLLLAGDSGVHRRRQRDMTNPARIPPGFGHSI